MQEKLADLKSFRNKFSILQTAGGYLTSATSLDTKTECDQLKKSLDDVIKSLESEVDSSKSTVAAEKSLQSEVMVGQDMLDGLNAYMEAQNRSSQGHEQKVKPCVEELIPQLKVK